MASEKGRDSEAETRRRQRLAAALRENLKRRKAQQRGREAVTASSAGREIKSGSDHKI
jgi:hypothetical protein